MSDRTEDLLERADMVQEALDQICQAAETIENAVAGTNWETSSRNYISSQLRVLAEGNGFGESVAKLLEQMQAAAYTSDTVPCPECNTEATFEEYDDDAAYYYCPACDDAYRV